MEALYRLNTKELGSDFINSVRSAYPNQRIEIMVRTQDETEYLLSSHANKEHLEAAIKNAAQGKIISFETIEQAALRARELAEVP
jgi:hypothetical protein